MYPGLGSSRPTSSPTRGPDRGDRQEAGRDEDGHQARPQGQGEAEGSRPSSGAGRTATITIPPHVDDELGGHWHEFKTTGAVEPREKLILHYAPLVKYVASRVATGLPASVEQADLVSYGMFGLIDALTQVRARPGQQVRDLRDPADQGRHHR